MNGFFVNDSKHDVNATISGSLANQIKGVNQLMISNTGTIPASTDITVLDTTKPVDIDVIVWSTNINSTSRLRIMPYIDGVATSMADVKYDGSGVAGFYPAQMMLYSSSFFDFLEYDTVNNYYKFKLSKNLTFAEGVKIMVGNTSTGSTPAYSILILGREYD